MKYLVPLSILLAFSLLISCQKEFLNPDNDGPRLYFDPSALKFIDSAQITDSIQKDAINTFVIELKDSLLWNKFLAIYPMVGGMASTMKWNLKDPRDLDSAYRLTFSGQPVFAWTGVLFQTSDDYADSHLVDSAFGGFDNSAISYYSVTQNEISGYDMGCNDDMDPYNELSIYCNKSDNSEWFGFKQDILTPNTKGLFMLSSSSTNAKRYRNGVVIGSKNSPPHESYTNVSVLIGTPRLTHPGQKECALATIGYGLTDAEAMTFYQIVQRYQNKLGR